jgi:hypothetical protein
VLIAGSRDVDDHVSVGLEGRGLLLGRHGFNACKDRGAGSRRKGNRGRRFRDKSTVRRRIRVSQGFPRARARSKQWANL